jgi:hypothetical protein
MPAEMNQSFEHGLVTIQTSISGLPVARQAGDWSLWTTMVDTIATYHLKMLRMSEPLTGDITFTTEMRLGTNSVAINTPTVKSVPTASTS